MHSRVFIQPKTKPHLLPAGRPHRMREYHYSLRSCHRRSRHPVFGGIRNRDESLGGKRRRLSFCRVVALTFGGLPFRADRGGPRQYAIRLSKSGGGKYAFTSIGKIIGASEPVLRRSRKNSPHPVFHTFLRLTTSKSHCLQNRYKLRAAYHARKKDERDIRLPKARMSSVVSRCPSLNSHRKSKSAPPHFYWQKNRCFHNRFEIFFEKLFSTLL